MMLMCSNLSNCVAYIPSKKRCSLQVAICYSTSKLLRSFSELLGTRAEVSNSLFCLEAFLCYCQLSTSGAGV
jgi:hypothetical protein